MTTVERIKSICKERKIPISRLEKDLNFGNAYISGLKKGTVPDDRLRLISKYLDVSVEYLMTGKESRLSKINANIDYMMLTDDDSRNIIIEYQKLDDGHKEMLKKYMEFLKSDMK